jgi:hypothetical protein
LHGITLTEGEKRRLSKEHSKNGKINFKDAIQTVNVDLDQAILREQKWQVSDSKQKAEGSIAPVAMSHLSRMTLEEFKQR